jgi:hypothetical protein
MLVIRGCMFLLSLTATCQVWTVALKAGHSTYKGFAADRLQRRLKPSVGWLVRRSKHKSLMEGQLAGAVAGSVWILSPRYDECTCVRAWTVIDGEHMACFCTRATYRTTERLPELNDTPRRHGEDSSQIVQPDPKSVAGRAQLRCAQVVTMRKGLTEAWR